MILRAALLIGVGLVCLYAFITSFDFPAIAGYFPRFAGAAGVIFALFGLLTLYLERRELMSTPLSDEAAAANKIRAAEFRLGVIYVGWVAALVLLTYLFGILIAAAIWLPLYTAVTRKIRWVVSLSSLAGLEVALIGLQYGGLLHLPASVFV